MSSLQVWNQWSRNFRNWKFSHQKCTLSHLTTLDRSTSAQTEHVYIHWSRVWSHRHQLNRTMITYTSTRLCCCDHVHIHSTILWSHTLDHTVIMYTSTYTCPYCNHVHIYSTMPWPCIHPIKPMITYTSTQGVITYTSIQGRDHVYIHSRPWSCIHPFKIVITYIHSRPWSCIHPFKAAITNTSIWPCCDHMWSWTSPFDHVMIIV